MEKVIQTTAFGTMESRRVWFCLILSLSLLCNPFLSASTFSGALSFSHLPSYRATVASAELLKSKNPESYETGVFAIPEFVLEFAVPQPPLQQFPDHLSTEISLPSEKMLSGSLWFRPPPVA